MPIHHFTLIVDGPDVQNDALIDALFIAGCDDGLVGRAEGIQYIDFDREAAHLEEAILSAVADVEKVPGVTVARIADAGLVSMADIAVRIGRTREGVRLLVAGARGPGGFPPPVTHPGARYRLWRWSEVERWLTPHLGKALGSFDADVLTAINASLELRRHSHRLHQNRQTTTGFLTASEGDEMDRKILSVFVASPDDVGEERNRLEDVIREMNTTWARQLGIQLELVRWETHAYPGFGDDPQAVINEQIPQDWDIFIGLMWYRFGTPTSRAGSGTVEEFRLAKKRYDNDPSAIQLMIYFKDAPAPVPPSQLDHKQLASVSEFRSRLGQEGGLYWTFQTTDDFEKLVRLHLSRCVQKDLLKTSKSSPPAPTDKTAATFSVGSGEDDDGENGLFDLMEQVDDDLSIVREVTERITDATSQIGETMKARTAELNEFTAGPNANNRKAGKRLLEKAATDMDQYVHRMESELPLFSKHLNSGMTALVQAATLSTRFKVDDNNREQTKTNAQNIREFRETMINTESQMADFRQTVVSLPPITRALNRSKRAMATVLQRLIDELHGAQVMAREAETSLASVVEDE